MIDSNNGSPTLPASFLSDVKSAVDTEIAQQQTMQTTDGRAPNDGNFALPHILTFQGLLSTVSKIYRASDEALQQSYENARFMLNDVGIQECLLARQRSVALLDWKITPEDEENEDHKELCTQLERIVRRIKHFTEYRRTMQNAIWFGRYAIQHQYRWVDIGGKMRVLPAPDSRRGNWGWKPIHGDKLVFRHDEGDWDEGQWAGQVGIRVGQCKVGDVINNGANRIEMTDRGMGYFLNSEQRNLLAIHRHMIEDGAFESAIDAGMINGVGIRSRIYWEWFQKQATMALIMEYLQRSLGGIELWYYDEGNPNARSETERAAKERQGGRFQLLVPRPRGEDAMAYGVEIIQPDTAGIEAFERVITNFFGHRIKRLILGQTLSSEAAATGLGSGVAELHYDTFMQIIQYDSTAQEEMITDDLVNPIKDWNFPAARDINVLFQLKTKEPDIERKMESWGKAFDMGCRLKESEVMDMVGASVPGDGDHVLQSTAFSQQGQGGDGSGLGTSGSDVAGGMFTGPGPIGPSSINGVSASMEGGPGRRTPGGDGASLTNRMESYAAEIADEVKSGLADSEIDDSKTVTLVNEGGEWETREIPDAGHDTGDRSREDADDIIDVRRNAAGGPSVSSTFHEGSGAAGTIGARSDRNRYAKSADEAAAITAFSPSEDQREAGNYRKGKFRFHGMTIAIETPKGSERTGTNRDGELWTVTMPVHYGYILRTEGNDGDHVDVFVGPDESSEIVFVVDQNTGGGRFDEHKVLVGFSSEADAKSAYLKSYSDDAKQRIRNVTAMTVEQFKSWLESGDVAKPLAGQVSRYRRGRDRYSRITETIDSMFSASLN